MPLVAVVVTVAVAVVVNNYFFNKTLAVRFDDGYNSQLK